MNGNPEFVTPPPGRTDVVAPPVIKKVSWGAIFAGAFVALAVLATLALLGFAVGLSAFNPDRIVNPTASIGVGTGIWWLIISIIAFFVGGWVSSRLVTPLYQSENVIHGIATWALATVGMLVLASTTAGVIMGGALGVVGNAVAGNGPMVERMLMHSGYMGAMNPGWGYGYGNMGNMGYNTGYNTNPSGMSGSGMGSNYNSPTSTGGTSYGTSSGTSMNNTGTSSYPSGTSSTDTGSYSRSTYGGSSTDNTGSSTYGTSGTGETGTTSQYGTGTKSGSSDRTMSMRHERNRTTTGSTYGTGGTSTTTPSTTYGTSGTSGTSGTTYGTSGTGTNYSGTTPNTAPGYTGTAGSGMGYNPDYANAQLRQVATQAAHTAATAAGWTFVMLILSLAAAALGAGLSAPKNIPTARNVP